MGASRTAKAEPGAFAARASGWISAIAGETDAAGAARVLVAFRRFLLLHGCARSWLWVALAEDLWRPGLVASALVATVAFALVWRATSAWLGPRVMLAALLAQLALSFPLSDNHFLLEIYAVGLLCGLGPKAEDDATRALGALRWLCAIVLFHTGVQKVLHGLYFDGQFLAWMIGEGSRFAGPFSLVVSDEQIALLRGHDTFRTGQGPYRVDSWLFVAVSNAVWILEMALPVGLALARTRALAAWGALLLVAGIQLAAREMGFAFLFANLLLLFTARGNAWALPALAPVYLYALGAVTGLLPGGDVFDPGWL